MMQQTPLSPPTSTVPQFVVIHDQMQQSWKHPVVHYVFEDEPLPLNVPKERCVLVNLSEDGESVADCHSLSYDFQVTNCKISLTPQMQMNATGQSGSGGGIGGGKDASGTSSATNTTGLMLTIEGMSSK